MRNRRGGDRRGVWLSPDAYDALSAEEKRAIWLERKQEQQLNQRPTRRSRRSSGVPWTGWAMVGALAVGIAAWELKPTNWFSSPVAAASGALAVTETFDFCHTSGRTNCVVDGDTIWLQGQTIRIADIDAPETHEYRCSAEKELGDRATERLYELVNSGPITLRTVDRNRDRYGRNLRLVLVDGKSVGDTLVREGLARYYRGGKKPWC